MKKEILHYLRAKYFKIYSLNIFAGQKKSLIGPDLARGPPYADRCNKVKNKIFHNKKGYITLRNKTPVVLINKNN
jgi:hypothetical protein